MTEQLALALFPELPPAPPGPDPFAGLVDEVNEALSRLLLPCSVVMGVHSSVPGARASIAERCRVLPPALCDRLMAGLELAARRAEEEVQHLRELHAEILGCDVSELDDRLAAEKAEEDRMRQEARSAAPARAPKGKAAKGGETIGIGLAALSPRQRELLAFVKVENNVAVFDSSERVPDWDLLKRIMLALGGTWKTGSKKSPGGFRFPDDLDAAELVRLAKESGEILDPRAAEFFATPAPLARLMVERAEIRPGDHVLEPSAGRGAIALVARTAGAVVRCVEPFPANAQTLEDEGFAVMRQDFLTLSLPGSELLGRGHEPSVQPASRHHARPARFPDAGARRATRRHHERWCEVPRRLDRTRVPRVRCGEPGRDLGQPRRLVSRERHQRSDRHGPSSEAGVSDSLEFILDQRAHHDAAIREALKRFPDLHYEGRHLVSTELRREDCDRIYIVPGDRGDYIRLGKKVGDVTVLCSSHDWVSPPAYDFFRNLKKRHGALYAQLVKLLADSRGML